MSTQAKKSATPDRGLAIALARAIWIENQESGATAEERKQRLSEWKTQPKEQKKSMMSLARRVLKRLDRAGIGLVQKSG